MGDAYEIAAVIDSSAEFLNHLKSINLTLGSNILVKEKFPYDNSIQVESGNRILNLSAPAAQNLLVQKAKKK
jgi:DtxR family transcriptional regulator, Mn-dependent transcriptional regulator